MKSSGTTKAIGRPSFRIDPARLRGLREEKSLTQVQTIELAHKHRGRPVPSAAVKQYQRIEQSGKTSKAMADALAAVLGTTVAVLQGEAPVDESDQFIDRLEQHLADQIARKCNPALEEDLARCGRVTPRDLAVEFLERVESALFDGRQDALDEIAQLTGWTVQKLSQPVAIRGHWLVSSDHGRSTAEVVFGADRVTTYVRQIIEEHAIFKESDARVTLNEALPKLFVEALHPRHAALRCVVSFKRCIPSSTGLQWVNPNWRDRFFLEISLRRWADSTFNFVTGFDGQCYPSDIRQLRLEVEQIEELATGRAWKQSSLIEWDIDEMTGHMFKGFQQAGRSHEFVLKQLATNAADEIKPMLEAWPFEYWSLRDAGWCIFVDLKMPMRLALSSGQFPGPRYRISLVEELPDGQLRPAPWRASSVDATCTELKQRLGMLAS